MTAKANDKVKVHYKGTLKNGDVFDSSEGKNSLEFTLGKRQVIPGFDKDIEVMELNEFNTINIPSAEAYGEVEQEFIWVPKSQRLKEINPKAVDGLIPKPPAGIRNLSRFRKLWRTVL